MVADLCVNTAFFGRESGDLLITDLWAPDTCTVTLDTPHAGAHTHTHTPCARTHTHPHTHAHARTHMHIQRMCMQGPLQLRNSVHYYTCTYHTAGKFHRPKLSKFHEWVGIYETFNSPKISKMNSPLNKRTLISEINVCAQVLEE